MITPKFVNRNTSIPKSTSDLMPTERLISYVQSVYPDAKLIPNSKTYNRAVAEYNIVVRMGMERPPIPKWFCGNINSSTGELGATFTSTPISDRIESLSGETGSSKSASSNEYAWDDCLLSPEDKSKGKGCSPGTPDYVLCYSDELGGIMASTIDSTFWDDFMLEYDEEARGGLIGACASKEALKDLVIRMTGISEDDRTSPVKCWICGQERANRGDLCEHVCKSHSDNPDVRSAGGIGSMGPFTE